MPSSTLSCNEITKLTVILTLAFTTSTDRFFNGDYHFAITVTKVYG